MREDLDERLVVARWLRRQPRRCVVDLPPERLADEEGRRKAAAAIAGRLRRVAEGARLTAAFP